MPEDRMSGDGVSRAPTVMAQARRQPFAQLTLFVAVVIVTVAACLIDPSLIGPDYVVAALVVAVLTAAMIEVKATGGGARGTSTSLWFAVIPLLDIAACVIIRASLVDVLPVGGLLVIFPIAWLSFAFPLPLMLLGVVGTGLVTAFPYLRDGTGIETVGDWAGVLALPVVVTLFALASASVGRDLARRQNRLEQETARARVARRSSLEAELTIRALVETSPDALAVLGLDGRPIVANDAALAVELAVDEVLSGDHAEPVRVLVGPPGAQRILSVSSRPVMGAADEAIAVVMAGHDVTELVRDVQVRDSFLDDVGHELKTPLTAILGHADLLADSPDAAAAAQAVTIRRAAERQLGIVNQLMAAGRRTVERAAEDAAERTAAGPVVERAVETARDGAARKGVDLAVVLDAHDGSDLVRFAARDLQAVVEALVANAVLFTPAGGTVVVGLRPEGDGVVLEVSDSGIGMTDDEQQHAFDRFYRAPAAREQAVPGLGLGLSIARSLAETHGAEIAIDSEPGRGTVVTVRMQAADGFASDAAVT